MSLNHEGILGMMEWVHDRSPECLPKPLESCSVGDLFPHGGKANDNELLVELAGRKCYNSFGEKAGRKTNAEYIAHTQQGDVPHASILYHAKMSFFIAGVSRRVSHELIRNYVGADRDEEGSPSQESTRYVEHPGFYVVHPRYLGSDSMLQNFRLCAQANYAAYRTTIDFEKQSYRAAFGAEPKGIDYKRILEAGSSLLMHSVETSFVWTTNPMALAKLFRERDHDMADLEFRRLAQAWKRICLERWPNLFPQPWMRPEAPTRDDAAKAIGNLVIDAVTQDKPGDR